MNKKELNQKLNDLEAEASKLRSLINKPWPELRRTAGAGDVWSNGTYPFLLLDSVSINLDRPSEGDCLGFESFSDTRDTYLGKFDEVYVKIADVRDALSIGNSEGHCFLAPGYDVIPRPHYIRSRKALAKLGIKY